MNLSKIKILGLTLAAASMGITLTFLLMSAGPGEQIRNYLKPSPIDRSTGWYPYEVGNYWINRDFVPCDPHNPYWYWEVVKLLKTDSADFFQIEMRQNPCDSAEYTVHHAWYAYSHDDKVFMVNDKLEYYDMEADFGLMEEGQSFIRQDLRYTLLSRTENRMKFEYDLYHDDTYHFKFEKGIGRDIGWEEIRISGVVYKKDFYGQWRRQGSQ